jgi:hypothetical protein
VCEAIAYLKFRHLGHYFVEQSGYQDAPLSKILHLIWSAGWFKGRNKEDVQRITEGPA